MLLDYGFKADVAKNVQREEKLATAKRLKNLGVEIGKIVIATGLTRQEIEEL